MGIYVASRVKHADLWRQYRSSGYNITSSWIDEAGEGETSNFSELWERIRQEIVASDALVLYVLKEDYPLKGALVEVGMAFAFSVPIFVFTDADLEGRTMRPIGSWILNKRVRMCSSLTLAMQKAREV